MRGLVPPPGTNVSFQVAEKGSYRQAHIVRYLERWLDPWTDQRQAAGDWRILYMDVAASHVVDEVVQFAHGRGYVTLFHYGCTTGVAQINDTDCHAELEAFYCELEQAAFHNQQLWDPGNISRTLQNVLNDLCGAWRMVDHERGLRGHKMVGLNNALDGTEDHLITREARIFWLEANMSEERHKAILEVDALVDSGEVTDFAEWQKLIRHPENPGVVEDEGAELDGDWDDGECLWQDDETDALRAADDIDAKLSDVPDELPVVVACPGDAPADVEDAMVAARRLQSLKRLRAAAVADNVPAAVFHVEREVNQLERGLRAGGRQGERRVNMVLRRHMDTQFREEADRISKQQAKAFKLRCDVAKVKASAAKAKAKKEKAADDNKVLLAMLDKLPKKITADTCGLPGAKGSKERSAALERIKLRSPKLSVALEARWNELREAYAANVPLRFKWVVVAAGEKALGVDFVKQVNVLLKGLGTFYQGNSEFNKPGMKGGDAAAFVKFIQRMEESLPVGGVVAMI
jgi:hypothetical protein